ASGSTRWWSSPRRRWPRRWCFYWSGPSSSSKAQVRWAWPPSWPAAPVLAILLSLVGDLGANLLDVEHIREGFDLDVRESAVQLVLETRGPRHAAEVQQAVRDAG